MVKNDQRHKKRQKKMLLFTAVFILFITIGFGTAAFMIDKTDTVNNIFHPSKISCEVEEEFNGEIKRNINVKNTSEMSVYVRLKLATYRINDSGDRIGGTAQLPDFTPEDGWFFKDGLYYYSLPVSPDSEPAVPLIGNDGIKLIKYDDADGGKQTVEVIAQAIQADPSQAVTDAWGVTVSADGRISQ